MKYLYFIFCPFFLLFSASQKNFCPFFVSRFAGKHLIFRVLWFWFLRFCDACWLLFFAVVFAVFRSVSRCFRFVFLLLFALFFAVLLLLFLFFFVAFFCLFFFGFSVVLGFVLWVGIPPLPPLKNQ